MLTRSTATGPRRPLPDLGFPELFERQADVTPGAIAVEHADGAWSYGELRARVAGLVEVLRAHGIGREDVVGVVSGRSPSWVAAVLGILAAGGCYLPVEPDLPAARIRTMLGRAGARVVLAEPGRTGKLDQALTSLPDVRAVDLGDAVSTAGGGRGSGPLEAVAPTQAAYIFFTSGSTGEPKGAVCEHAGLINHLLAKVEDLGIGPRDVVAQTAPRSFDISLWQVCAPLLVGARTLLVDHEALLDTGRFVDTLVDRRVTVAQLVPSYLESLVTWLEQEPRGLPDLRRLSVTGEPLPRALAERWFALHPDVPLVNAYGLTETSDDTNHAVLHEAPDRVTVGPPIRNVTVSVVDETLTPVALGEPGEVVFSGVCVGRGYVNDPERTAAAYVDDPCRPGTRLYRSGDLGRMLPDGSLEFAGRRDDQVKVRGFRIELGEVEDALERLPGVRHAAAVVAHRDRPQARLEAFYRADHPLDADAIRSDLARRLPGYLVPAAVHHLAALPLTGNGKVDRAALSALAEQSAVRVAGGPPESEAERRLAAAWATVLDVAPQEVGRRDHFFDRGGTSLSAVRLVLALDRAVSPADVARHPELADLAALLATRSVPLERSL